MSVLASRLAQEAIKLAQYNPPIPYRIGGRSPSDALDCSTMIMWLLEQCGGKNLRATSNRLWSEHAAWRGTLADAQREGKLVPGALVLIDAEKGGPNGTPGRMIHAGLFVGGKIEIVHASQSRGGVYPSTLKNAWTHVMWLKGVDYSGSSVLPGVPPAGTIPPAGFAPPATVEPGPGQAKVVTTTSGLRLRKLPSTSAAVIKEMPIGAVVDVLYGMTVEHRVAMGNWVTVRYVDSRGTPHEGWCCAGMDGVPYLQFG